MKENMRKKKEKRKIKHSTCCSYQFPKKLENHLKLSFILVPGNNHTDHYQTSNVCYDKSTSYQKHPLQPI